MGHTTTHNCGDTADALRNVRAGCSVRMKLKITDGGVALDWNDPLLSIGDVAVWSQARQGIIGRPVFSVSDDDPDILVADYTTAPADLPGPHRLLVTVRYDGWTAVHTVLAYNLVGSAYGSGTSVTVSEECPCVTEVGVTLALHEIDTTYLQCLIDELVRLRVDESERLTNLETLYEGLRTDVDANTAAIKENAAAIKANAEDIAANTAAIKENHEAITSNTAAIEANSKAIKENADAIDTNSEAIKANSEAIKANTGDIAANAKAIAANAEAIGNNAKATDALAERMEKAEGSIGTLLEGMTNLTQTVTNLVECCRSVNETLDDLEERVKKLEEGGTSEPEPDPNPDPEPEPEPEYATLTITPDPSDATVVINGEERTELTAEVGTEIEWSVSMEGYVTQSGSLTLTEDLTLPVTLEKEERTITFNVSPTDATLTVNGSEVTLTDGTYTMTANDGDEISWSCEKDGYVSQNGSLTVDGDRTVNVTLEEEVVVAPDRTITFNFSPTDAALTVKGNLVFAHLGMYSMTAKDGDEISWSCEKDGYIGQIGNFTVDGNATITITLEEEEGDHHITVTPSSMTISAAPFGRTSVVIVDSDGSWTAEAGADWITLSQTEGESGTTSMQVSAETNTSAFMRSAEVTFTNEWGNTAVLAVTQEGDISSGGDPGGDDPDPEDNPDTITASSSSVTSGGQFTLTLTGTTRTLDATLTNMSATVGTVHLTIDGGTYELDTNTTIIPVDANSAYRCVLESNISGTVHVLFAHGDASVTVSVTGGASSSGSDAEAYSDDGGNG